MRFVDRNQAGDLLAEELRGKLPTDAVVLALPRGGVPIGAKIARLLGLEFDVFVARKLGAPHRPELGIGAIAEGGAVWIDRDLAQEMGATGDALDEIASREARELERRVKAYRGGRALIDVRGRPVVLVDDGIATGGTVRAAVRALRRLHPARIVIATPVVARETADRLEDEVDQLVSLLAPVYLDGIGAWYDDFRQVSDQEVIDEIARSTVAHASYEAATDSGDEALVQVPSDGVLLTGDLTIPRASKGIVIFAHGSGSSRLSVRNRAIARRLNAVGCATLLFDLLTGAEEADDRVTSAYRFDIALLSRRLVGAMDWVGGRPSTARLPIGLFGASTGAAAALIAAAQRPREVAAVVSRGGRVDLAGDALEALRCATLFVVGEADDVVLELNAAAFERLTCEKRLAVVPRATHLFEEPGALEHVGSLAAQWFASHFDRAAYEAGAPA